MDEFHYRIPWRTVSAHPGHHRSGAHGGGFEFHGHALLHRHGDPRHLDIRASLADPFGQFRVRQFLQTSLIPVWVVADLSASLQLGEKPALLGRLAAAIAYSAYRTGDLFGLVGIAASTQPAIHYPLRRYRGVALELRQRLQAFPMAGKGVARFQDSTPHLGQRRALVFLLSDFHFPLENVNVLLERLQPHDVIPVVLWISREWRPPARWGWSILDDPETGARRLAWFHPASAGQMEAHFQRRRRQLTELCRRHGRAPFFVIDHFNPSALTRYFLQSCA